ncbi:hypothetical protein [Luteimonas cellulosilyticus]|nr:hypothetical protein [Luteimonas cellulosilyticus]
MGSVSSVSAQEATPEALQPEIASAQSNGRMMFLHARAVAAVRAAMQEDRDMRRDRRIAGEVTEGRDGKITVTVLDETPAALYRATVLADGTIELPINVLPSPGQLSTLEAGAAQARATALAFDTPRCGKHYDTITFPTNEADQWVVYLMPRPARGSVPVGGAFRLETVGTTVTEGRSYTNTCIAMASNPKSEAMIITHLLDPVPTEVHVFWSLWEGKPFFVSTAEDGLWKIEEGRISPVENED